MRAGLNGAELARALEMEPGTWRRIERGERQLPFDLARQIAEVLDCAVDDLITGENVGSEVGSSLKVSLPSLRSVVDLPIFGVGDLSSNKVKLVRTGSFIARPGNVSENDAAYAMHVFDDAAAPRYSVTRRWRRPLTRYAHLAQDSVWESAVRVAESIAGDILAKYLGPESVAG